MHTRCLDVAVAVLLLATPALAQVCPYENLLPEFSWKLNPTLTAPEIFWMPRDMDGDLSAPARMPPEQVARQARKFLESLAVSPAKP